MRIFRILKLSKTLENFRRVIETICSVFPEMATFGCLLALFVFFYSVLGLHRAMMPPRRTRITTSHN